MITKPRGGPFFAASREPENFFLLWFMPEKLRPCRVTSSCACWKGDSWLIFHLLVEFSRRLRNSVSRNSAWPETAARKPPISARANDDGGIIGELFVARAFPSFVQLGLLSLRNSNGATSTR